ncbi:hypothetical protein ADM96_32430 [Burkholderia sp. ST111]|nr:hypothetical protein ADM96_32430 [Burkholderia sp. ST111]
MATAIAGFGTYDNESVESVIASSQGTGGGQEETLGLLLATTLERRVHLESGRLDARILDRREAWLRSDLMSIRQERSTKVIFYDSTMERLSDAAQSIAQKLLFLMAETLLVAGNENLFGKWSIADVDLALMLNRLAPNGDPMPQRLLEYVRY